MKTTLGLTVLLLCSSCVSYRHHHTNLDGTTDTTTFTSFLMMGNASKVRSATRMGTNYSRTVSVGSLEGKGDADFVAAITEGVVAGMKKSQGVP